MFDIAEKQDILEAAVMAIVTQGGPSFHASRGCMYRGPGGRRCIVGHFIDDAEYRKDFESHGVSDAMIRRSIAKSLGIEMDDEQMRFFSHLQGAHDHASVVDAPPHALIYGPSDFWTEFSKRIRKLCLDHNLRFPEELL